MYDARFWCGGGSVGFMATFDGAGFGSALFACLGGGACMHVRVSRVHLCVIVVFG